MSAPLAVKKGVQLHDLVEASPFADRVDLDARVSGAGAVRERRAARCGSRPAT